MSRRGEFPEISPDDMKRLDDHLTRLDDTMLWEISLHPKVSDGLFEIVMDELDGRTVERRRARA